MSKYPSESECVDMLRKAGCSRRIIVHCCTVKAVAVEIAKKFDADISLVVAGALLHDIGRAKDHTIMHATVGSQMAKEMGIPPEVIEIIRKHTGAGLDDDDVRSMNLPKGDYIPRTIEEKIVTHADNLVGDDKVRSYLLTVDKLRGKGLYRGAERVVDLHRELSEACGEDLDDLAKRIGANPDSVRRCSDEIGHL